MKKKKLRERIIWIKIREITDGVTLVQEHLPKTLREFRSLGLIKDGIYRGLNLQ